MSEAGRTVWSDSLAPGVGRSPKGALQRRRLPFFDSPSPPLPFWLASLLRRGRAGVGRRRGLGATAELRAPGHHLLAGSAHRLWGVGRLAPPPPPAQVFLRSGCALPEALGLTEAPVLFFFESRSFLPRSGSLSVGHASQSLVPEAQSFFFFFWRDTGKRRSLCHFKKKVSEFQMQNLRRASLGLALKLETLGISVPEGCGGIFW